MTRIAVLVLAAAVASGCYSLGKTTRTMTGYGAGVTFDHHGPAGAAAEVTGGAGGWYAAFGASARELHREGDPSGRDALGLDFALRVSPLGILANDHALERYLDFGAEAGVGFKVAKAPPHTVAVEGEAWVGGWVELGLMPASDGYVALTANVRTIDATEPWVDRPAEIMVGLAWRSRGAPQKSRAFLLTPN